jgi:lipid II:glycine glycyltransferase (peptidoglycan interpeptide bridge formation enzyme)
MTLDSVSRFRTTGTSSAAGCAVALRVVGDRRRWDALTATAPHPHLPQSFAYGAGKAATGWPAERVEFLLDGRTVAFATVLQIKRFGVTLLNRVNRGPVFLDAEPEDEVVLGVYRALRRHHGRFWQGPLLIAAALPRGDTSSRLLRKAGYLLRHERSWTSGRIDLTRSEDDIWRGFASTFRNRVRNAERSEARLEISGSAEAYEWMLARHRENMDAKGFSAATPAMLRALRDAAADTVTVFRMMAGDVPVAGMSVVSFGTHCEYHVGWFGPEGRKLNAGNFLMWGVMREMKRRGFSTFDVGGLKPGDGYTQFKLTMKPNQYELCGEWMSF